MTFYLRFPDEPTGMAALEAAGFLNDDGEVITASHTHISKALTRTLDEPPNCC